jgi:hypothetical protein
VGFEPDRDRFFQYATFVTLGLTVLVCACYALLFFNPRVNPIAGLRPETGTPNLSVAELPATWTPTNTPTATSTATSTPTFTPTNTLTPTPLDTFTPTFIPTPTIFYIIVTGVPPTRLPATRVPTPRPAVPGPPPPAPLPTQPPTPQFEFRLGRNVDRAPNCGTWYVAGTVYSDQAGSSRIDGVLVRVWASGIEQGTDTTGRHSGRPGYWEWIFGQGTATQGQVAIINPDGSLRSPQVSFNLTSDCNADGAVQQNFIDFVRQ